MKNFPIKKVREDKYSKNVTITNYRVFGIFPLPLTGSKSVDWISYLSLGFVLSLFLMVGIDSVAGTDLITSSLAAEHKNTHIEQSKD